MQQALICYGVDIVGVLTIKDVMVILLADLNHTDTSDIFHIFALKSHVR